MKKEMFADPEPPDEDDPIFKEEMFHLHRGLGDKPEDLIGATTEYKAEYAEWLKEQEQNPQE